MVFIEEIIYFKSGCGVCNKFLYKSSQYEYKAVGTHWIALYLNAENIPKEIRNFIGNKNNITNIRRIQG